MRPAPIASSTSRLGWMVLIPTRPPSASTSSKVRGSARAGLPALETQTRAPGASSPSMRPGLGQCTVTSPAAIQHDVREETLVPAHQAPGDQRGWPAHGKI